MRNLRAILVLVTAVSLVASLALAWQRIQYERAYDTVGIVMDYNDASLRAAERGQSVEQYLSDMKSRGVDGVAVYEDVLANLVERDEVVYRPGAEWRNDRRSLGQDVSGIDPQRYYLRSVKPGAAEAFAARYRYPMERATVDGQQWMGFPVDVRSLIAGPDLALIRRLEGLGLFVVYRPLNVLQAVDPGADFPKVPYLVFGGAEVTGYGDESTLERVVQRSAPYTTGMIEAITEGTQQRGILDIARENPVVRVFAIPADWQKVLTPEELASKYVLAARERNHRLLYVRPYPRP
ncbi:MAG TPA: DUF5693 family protein, partial [Deinococcales bacterium]|nr:DUF5693 family protein [Deinococcales bacterium]